MKQKIRWIVFILFALVIEISSCMASEKVQFNLKNSEIVFLFDSSSSMNTQDINKTAIDAVRQAIYSVPTNYQVGFVAYNTGIQTIIPFGEDLGQWDGQLEAITYSGYTNAGEGLYQAMTLFSEKEDINRYIIMLTDGEIDMPNSQDKEISRLLYEKMIQEAKEKGIKIYIIAVGNEWNDTKVHIFDGAEQTDGAIYWEGQSGDLSEIMKRILYDRINFPKNSIKIAEAAVIETTDLNESQIKHKLVTIEFPVPKAKHVKIILLSDYAFQEVEAKYYAKSGRVVTGQYFAAVDLTEPDSEIVTIQFDSFDISNIEAYLVAEYEVKMETQVVYRKMDEYPKEEQNTKDIKPNLKNIADISIYFIDIKGNILWDSEYYEGKEVSFTVNGVSVIGVIQNGKISYSMPIDGIEEAEIVLDISNFSERFEIAQAATILFSPPEDPPFKSELDYRPIWIILIGLLFILVSIVAFWIKKNKSMRLYMEQPKTLEKSVQIETKGYTYTGKLNLYIVQTQSEQDIPPQTYRLFGKQSRKITLNQILNSCGIRFGKIGAEEIFFYPGMDRSLIIMDQSEGCTILRGMEILKKGIGYPIYYNGKLIITFEDGITEMEVHYKNLKPSEREKDENKNIMRHISER